MRGPLIRLGAMALGMALAIATVGWQGRRSWFWVAIPLGIALAFEWRLWRQRGDP